MSWLALTLLVFSPAVAAARVANDAVEAPLDQGATSLFFAEGSTQTGIQTWFLVLNPTGSTANVTFTFELTGGGRQVSGPFAVPAMSRFSLLANNVIQNAAFATRIDSNQPIVAERSIFQSIFGDTGLFLTPQQSWLFADGSTQSPFNTLILLKNPDTIHSTSTTITYHLPGGATTRQIITLPPESRTTVDASLAVPNQTFATEVTSQLPIVVEQSEVRSPGPSPSIVDGAPSPSPKWFIGVATATTGQAPQPGVPFTSTLFLFNPQTSAVSATLKFYTTDGIFIQLPALNLPASSQTTVNLNGVRVLQNSAFGIEVDASGPIVVQRQMIFGSGTELGLFNTLGATTAKNQWLLAEGSTQKPFSEILYILNPNSQTMSARVTFFLQGGGAPQIANFTVPPNTLISIPVNSILPPNTAHGTEVVTNQPAIVERQIYFLKDGPGIFGGTDTIGFAP